MKRTTLAIASASVSALLIAVGAARSSAEDATTQRITNAGADHPLAGVWSGTAKTTGTEADLSVQFKPQDDGTILAFLDLPRTNIFDAALGPVELAGSTVVLAGRIRLDPDASGTHLSGTWTSRARRFDLDLAKGRELARSPSAPPARTAQPLWTFDAHAPIWSSPLSSSDRVIFGDNEGTLHVLESRSGRELWRFKTGGPIVARATAHRGRLYVPSDDGFVYALDAATEREVWRFDTHGAPVKREWPANGPYTYDYQASAVTPADGLLYVGSADGKLYAIEEESGRERWAFATGGLVRSTPMVANGSVFFGSFDGLIYALDATSGKLRWKYATGAPVNSSAAVLGDTVYIGSRSADFYALRADTGAARWKYFYWLSWVESSAALRDGVLYVGSSDYQRLMALDAREGRERWWFDTDGSAWSSPAVSANSVYIGAVGVVGYMADHRGGFFAVDRRTGRERWRFPMPAIDGSYTYGVASSPALADGRVYFGGLDGVFYAFTQ
jgi:outer membrane protein assembly factor BamB